MMNFKKNKKGLTLVEVLIYIALLGIILPIMSSILLYGFDSYKSNYKFIKQEDMVSNVSHLLRKDIENAKKITFNANKEIIINLYSNNSTKISKTWRFDTSDNTLKVNTITTNGSVTSNNTAVIADNIKASDSSFEKVLPSSGSKTTYDGSVVYEQGYIILTIKPVETNTKKFQNRNFTKPIITEFSVRYKEIQ